MIKTNIEEKAFVANALKKLQCDKIKNIVRNFVTSNHNNGFSLSKNKSHVNTLVDIIVNNPGTNFFMLHEEYKKTTNKVKKLTIRYGLERATEYQKKLVNRKRAVDNNTIWGVNYWLKKGYTEEEAKKHISFIQSKNSKKYHDSKPVYKLTNPSSINFWLNKGYTQEESENLRAPFIFKSVRSYETYIKKYGETLGLQKMQEIVNKRQATMISRYGSTIVNGYVSKESLKFFIKLYKKIRRAGIDKTDIYWGISGSREFATHHNGKNYFYDFTVKSKKLIVEYNNSFWHPRVGHEFKNPFLDKCIAQKQDELKHNIMTHRGFDIIVVWEDDDHFETINYILRKLNES